MINPQCEALYLFPLYPFYPFINKTIINFKKEEK